MTPQELKISILQRALQGKLVEQDSFEGYGCAEIEKMTQHKKRLLKSKEIKREKYILMREQKYIYKNTF